MDSLIALGSTASIIYGIIAIYMIETGLKSNNLELVLNYSMITLIFPIIILSMLYKKISINLNF